MRLFLVMMLSLLCLSEGKKLQAASIQDARMQMLENHVTDLQDIVRELTGRLEEIEHKLVQAQKEKNFLREKNALPPASFPPPTSPGKENPQAVSLYNNALDLLKSNQFPQALQAFQSFTQTHPQSSLYSSARYWVGVIYVIQGHHQDALHTFDSLLRQDPHSLKRYDILYKMAKCYQTESQMEEARKTIQRCLTLLEKDPQRALFKTIETQVHSLARELGVGEEASSSGVNA